MALGLTAPTLRAPTDHLRPPSPIDLLAHAHKDWLHVNVFVPERGVAALVNASLHGDTLSPTSSAAGTIVVHRAGSPPLAHVEVIDQRDARIDATAIAIGPTGGDATVRVALGEDGSDVTASAAFAGAAIRARGTAIDAPIVAEIPLPFGRGWIAWRALPRLALDGTITLDDEAFDLARCRAVGYHDHNWGRWCWGDDAGWSWGTFPAVPVTARNGGIGEVDGMDGITVTVVHRTDRHHRRGDPTARVEAGGVARDYPARTVLIERVGRYAGGLQRVPGAMAALRADRRDPHLPERVVITVDDGFDRLSVRFDVDEAVQLINADPVSSGHTFVHELFGRFECRGRFLGRRVRAEGAGVFEHVD